MVISYDIRIGHDDRYTHPYGTVLVCSFYVCCYAKFGKFSEASAVKTSAVYCRLRQIPRPTVRGKYKITRASTVLNIVARRASKPKHSN